MAAGGGSDGEMVDMPAAAVESAHDSGYNLLLEEPDEEEFGVALEFAGDLVRGV
jgi:hypothetical protein